MRIDVVGCGAATQMFHIPSLVRLLDTGSIRVRACLDVDPAAAAAVGEVLHAERSGVPDDDLADVDGVIVATPPESHAAIARRYIAAGKAVLLEKPFATSSNEAHELVGLAAARRVPVLVGHFRRFYPSAIEARRFIAAGALGRILRVDAAEGGRWEWPSKSDYVVRSPSGGVIFDTGSHLADLVLYVLGCDAPYGKVVIEIDELVKTPTSEPSHQCDARITVADGDRRIPIRFRISRLEPLPGVIKIVGERGTLLLPTSYARAPQLWVGGESFTLTNPVADKMPVDAMSCFVKEHLEWLEACEHPDSDSPLSAHRFLVLQDLLGRLAA